jgi:putative transcriptional regulator
VARRGAGKRVRWRRGLSREAFATRFRIPLALLTGWEHHRAEPDEAMRAYLQVIEREPEAVGRALATAAE